VEQGTTSALIRALCAAFSSCLQCVRGPDSEREQHTCTSHMNQCVPAASQHTLQRVQVCKYGPIHVQASRPLDALALQPAHESEPRKQ
jgi:hypothetical protein